MASAFRLQIVDAKTGLVVSGWQPGDRLETDLVDELCTRLTGKVGVFKTEAKALTAVKAAFGEMLLELKRRV